MVARKWIALAAVAALAAAACSKPAEEKKSLRVLTTVLPMYVLTRNVVGDAPGITVEAMLPPAVGCPHDYALTPGDMKKIAAADLFIANGYGLEEFLGDPIRQANPKLKVIETAELAKIEPIRVAEEHDAHAAAEEHHERGAFNSHTWVSPRNAIRQVREIEKALVAASPQNAEILRRNADAYVARLEGLAAEMETAVKSFPRRDIATFHDVFDYLCRDLGLNVVARIEVVHNVEPSAREMAETIRVIREHKAPVFSEPQYSPKLAQVIGRAAGVSVRELDPVASGHDAPDAYETAMRKNLAALKEVLGP